MNKIANYTTFKLAYLNNRFWGPNTVEVPNASVVINEDFVDIDSVLRLPEQILHFKVYWVIKGVSGTICVPGQWNYAYIDGNFFLLTKGDSMGFIEGVDEEWFYYNITFDDGQNAFIRNKVYLKGTLDLTGDQELVRQNLFQIPPLLENVNGRRFLNGIRISQEERVEKATLLLPEKLSDHLKSRTPFTVGERLNFNRYLGEGYEKIRNDQTLAEPNETKLNIPLLYRLTRSGNGKNTVLKALQYHADQGFLVYDVTRGAEPNDDSQAGKFRNLLQNLLHSENLYAVASRSNRVYVHARAVNPALYVDTVDLSACNDITILDSLTLAKRYTLDNPAPKFNLTKFVDWVCQRQEGSSDLKDRMKDIFQEEFVKSFSGILASGKNEDNKVFKDVTLEKIQRDLVGRDHGKNYGKNAVPVLNPEWLNGADTRLQNEKVHRNFIWDNARSVEYLYNFSNFNEKYETLTDEQKNTIKERTRNYIEEGKPRGDLSDIGIYPGTTTLRIRAPSAFIYLPDKYKMVSADDKEEFLDFSYNYNDRQCEGLALIPDYSRKTHTIALLNDTKQSYYNTGLNNIHYNTKNARHRNRVDDNGNPVPVYPIIFNEILNVEEKDAVLDWKKPSNDFLRVYKTLGITTDHPKNSDGTFNSDYRDSNTKLRAAGAEILSRGLAFMALNSNVNNSSSDYLIKHNHGNSVNNHNNYKYSYAVSFAQRPECVYTSDKREGRRFHTEMTFPVKTEGFSVLDKLREFDDIPDNFLRGEVVNTNIKKGKIKAYTRSFVGPGSDSTKSRNNDSPGAYRLLKEEEQQIPPNTMVSIYICLRQSGSPEGDAAFDKKASDEYRTKYGREGQTRMEELLYGLCRYFFLTKGESDGERGAIPDGIKVYGAPNYPPNGDGRSQIGLSGMKPHEGRWYVAWTRFFAPSIENEAFRIMDNSGKLFPLTDPNGRPSKDFIMTEIQNGYYDSGDYFAKYTYRKHSSNVDMNTLLAFYYGNLSVKRIDGSNKAKESIENFINRNGNLPNDFKSLNSGTDDRKGTLIFNENKHNPNQLFNINTGSVDNRKSDGYRGFPADLANHEGKNYLRGWDTLILYNFIRNAKTYKTARLDNPKELPNIFKDPEETQTFTAFENEIPPFMVHYLDPEDRLSNLSTWAKNTIVKTDEQRLQLYREKLQGLFRATTEMLETWGIFMKFEGTNGYANMQLNTKDMVWDFELFCDESTVFKTRGQDKWNFVNHKENDVDVLINTRNELKIYGNTFVLKSRKHTDEDMLDIGLYVKPLLDQKQTVAAQGYMVTMNLNDQDVIEEIVETPKEITAYAGYNYMDKERLVRELGMQNAEFLFRKQMIDFQKQENKINDQYEKDMEYYAGKYSVIDGATGILTGLSDMAIGAWEAVTSFGSIRVPSHVMGSLSNKAETKGHPQLKEGNFMTPLQRGRNALQPPHRETFDVDYDRTYKKWHGNFGTRSGLENRRLTHWGLSGASTFSKGLSTVFRSGMTIGRAYDEGYTKDPRRQQMFELTNSKLIAEGSHLNIKHEHARTTILREIGEASANVAYPQLNSAMVYREHNKQRNLNDIHIVQYYPNGNLMNYLKKYYHEFGYQILVKDFECTGIKSIKRHLRFQFVYENHYNDITIKEMIQNRALLGIKVVPWIQ